MKKKEVSLDMNQQMSSNQEAISWQIHIGITRKSKDNERLDRDKLSILLISIIHNVSQINPIMIRKKIQIEIITII